MNKKMVIVLLVIALVQLACGPTVQVVNNSTDTVRLSIANKTQRLNITSRPGDDSTMDLNVDQYRAVVIPSSLWMESMKAEEAMISQMVADPESMTEGDVIALANRINKIYENEQQLFDSAPGQATCANSVDNDNNGRIEISSSADSNLSLYCTRVKNATEQP